MARYTNIPELESDLNGTGLRIGIVMSRFNIDVSEGLLGGCAAELEKNGVQAANILRRRRMSPESPIHPAPRHARTRGHPMCRAVWSGETAASAQRLQHPSGQPIPKVVQLATLVDGAAR